MKDFFTKKREYLESLKNNEILLQGIMSNKNNNSPEMMVLVFDPKTEEELNLAISITTILSDTLNIIYWSIDTEIEDISKEPIVDLFRKIILAVRDNNERVLKAIKEEVTRETTPETLGKLSYNMIKVFTLNTEEAFEYLATQCGFDLYDNLSATQFNAYFSRANELLNEMMPTVEVNGKLDLKNKELISYYSRFASSFHKSYQEDLEKKQGLKK